MASLSSESDEPSKAAVHAVARIEQHYTHAILSGRLKPGTKLPPSNQIAREWSVSATAVQRAMRRLSGAGLVDRERKSGTVVRNRTERAFVGVIVGPGLADEIAHFYRAIVKALESQFSRYGLSCRVYDGVHPMSLPTLPGEPPLALLEIDRLFYRFKGFVLLSCGTTKLPQITASGLPKVALEWQVDLTDISDDLDRMAFDILKEIGLRRRRRVLVLSTSREGSEPTYVQVCFLKPENNPGRLEVQLLTVWYQQQGLQMEKAVFEKMSEVIANWKKEPATKPDAVVVLDDIAARAVCMALLKFQVDVPREMEIVVLATEMIEHHYGMPVHRFEKSYLKIADLLASLLWKRITGEALPELPIQVPGRFKPMSEPE